MCAIVDANVVGEVFGQDRPEAGQRFFEWLVSGKGVLIAGGKVYDELGQSKRFQELARSVLLAGRLRTENTAAVAERAQAIKDEGACASDDPHVLALAQVSGARLLYTNDRTLQRDFTNGDLIAGPRGKVYTTLRSQAFTKTHRRLLSNKALCRSGP